MSNAQELQAAEQLLRTLDFLLCSMSGTFLGSGIMPEAIQFHAQDQ